MSYQRFLDVNKMTGFVDFSLEKEYVWVSDKEAEYLVTSRPIGLPFWLCGKESACSAGDSHLIPDLGRSPGEGNGNPVQYSCLGNPMGRGAWQATVRWVSRVKHDLVTKTLPPEGISW